MSERDRKRGLTRADLLKRAAALAPVAALARYEDALGQIARIFRFRIEDRVSA